MKNKSLNDNKDKNKKVKKSVSVVEKKEIEDETEALCKTSFSIFDEISRTSK